MDEALGLRHLRTALGRQLARLPTPEELQSLLVDLELALFVRDTAAMDDALIAAWALHARALSAEPDDTDNARLARGSAASVSAHVFDLYLQLQRSDGEDSAERLRYLLAGQSAYHVAGLTPNAIALDRFVDTSLPSLLVDDPGLASMSAARLLLAQRLSSLVTAMPEWNAQLNAVSAGWTPINESPYAATAGVLSAVNDMMEYLISGDAQLLENALVSCTAAIRNPFSLDDADSRWTASLLSDFASILGQTSVWSVLPPSTPRSVGRALVHGDPPIFALWPPQVGFLKHVSSPLAEHTRRMILSLPTSAGKTLVSQIVVLDHVARTDSDACIIAPTHALCREIRESLNSRLAHLGTFAVDGSYVGDSDVLTSHARVLVTTPERFSAVLRSDPAMVLDRFGMYIVDEAHLLAEKNRGWRLEETLALLHSLTAASRHRIVIVSAALGDAAHARQWLTLEDEPLTHSTSWRGPRRLHALYGTDKRDTRLEPAHGRRNARRHSDLQGVVYVRRPGGPVVKGKFDESAGTLVERQKNDGTWTKDSASTNQVLQLLPLVSHLLDDDHNNCLVVVAQRREAREVAEQVASIMPERQATQALAQRLADRLTVDHPLVQLVARGVAFHHGLLPQDVQADIERAASQGLLRCVVATATLTEGVNLAFKSVIIASRGWGSGEDQTVIIDAPRLLNAVGRAGRACRETEGWLFLSIHEHYRDGLLRELRGDTGDLGLKSSLSSADALETLSTFERALAISTDAILADRGLETSSFCSYVWLIAEVLEQLVGRHNIDDVLAVLRSTLAWTSLSERDRNRWERLAVISRQYYEVTDPQRRSRWSRSGVSLASNQVLESVVEAIEAMAIENGPPESLVSWINIVISEDVLGQLLGLHENESVRVFKPYRSAPASRAISVRVADLVREWILGVDLDSLASGHLSAISDADYRADALSEFVTSVLEHHLPWMLSVVVSWYNGRAAGDLMPEDLPVMVRFGAIDRSALELMRHGVRSRRLANTIANNFPSESAESLVRYLRSMTISQWRREFGASATEVSDLLAFVSDPSDSKVAALIDRERVSVGVQMREMLSGATDVVVREVAEGDPPLLVIFAGESEIATVAPQDYSHVQLLNRLGLRLSYRLIVDPPQVARLEVSQE